MKNKEKTHSLDLSYAYGTATFKCLEESAQASPAAQSDSSGDTTIRAITCLFTGTRRICGLDTAEGYEPVTADENALERDAGSE